MTVIKAFFMYFYFLSIVLFLLLSLHLITDCFKYVFYILSNSVLDLNDIIKTGNAQ